MAGGLKITLNDDKLKKLLSTIARDVKDFSVPLDSAADEMLIRYNTRVFERQAPDDGPNWESLSSRTTYARMHRQGYYKKDPIVLGKILIWTGRLKAGFKKNVERLRMTIYNDVFYFKYQQPTRPMLFVNDSIRGLVARNVLKYVKSILK